MDIIEECGLRQYQRGVEQVKNKEREEFLSKLAAHIKSKSDNQLTDEQAIKEAGKLPAGSDNKN